MLRGSCTDMRHPFISLYEMQPFTWPYIVQQTSNIISCGEVNLQCLKQIKPFVLYILCCGPSETRASLWSLLIGKLSNANSSEILDWLLESLLWQNQVQQSFQLLLMHNYFKYVFILLRVLIWPEATFS